MLKRWEHRYMTIDARGCPQHCTYCCNSQLARRFDWTFVRRKSVGSLIEELRGAVSRYPEMQSIKLSDDAFGDLPVAYIREFADAYKREIGLPLGVPGFSPSNLTREKLEPLVDAGLDYVRLGIQSGSPRVRKLYGRHDTNRQIVDAVNLVHEFRPRIKRLKLDIITDNPWETDEEAEQTIRLLLQLPKPYVMAIFSLTLFPGTPLYLKAKREGALVDPSSPVYCSHFYNFDGERRLNKVISLFKRSDVYRDKIEKLLDAHRDGEKFDALYEEYPGNKRRSRKWRALSKLRRKLSRSARA